MKLKKTNREQSSFRDPSGHIFYKNGNVFRQVNIQYKNNFDLLISSGLYKTLVKKNYLIPHTVVSTNNNKNIYAILKPGTIPFISYAYEWSFSQLKDAALLTLKIQEIALEYGMSLKDASNYNIQFLNGKPILIDLLSFEKYELNKPWIAYRQFCQHFFGPLLLMSHIDPQLNNLLRIYIDGIPLDITSKLLPKLTYLRFSIATHIHLHSKKQKELAGIHKNIYQNQVLSKSALLGIVDNLKSAISKLKIKNLETEWGKYYTFTNYSNSSLMYKEKIIRKYIKLIKPKTVCDFGSNSGRFSRVASNLDFFTISTDIDPVAVEANYLKVKATGEKKLLPLIIDLNNPSANIGWANYERMSFMKRGHTDLVMALALIHHLSITNNVPFDKVSNFFHKMGKFLIIEFVPKSDSQVKKLLKTREDVFPSYTQENFESTFSKKFKIIDKELIPKTTRTCYLMKAKP